MVNFSKKILAVALSVILIVSLIPASVFSALALTPADCADSPLLALDTPTAVTYTGEEISGAFRFVPDEGGIYVFYSSGEEDTYGQVLNEYSGTVASNDDGGEGSNFRMSFSVEAGKTYYLLTRQYYNNACEYTVTIKKFVSPVERVDVENVNVIKDLSGYEYYDSEEMRHFHYEYQTPSFTVYFKDGSDPVTSTYGSSVYIDGQYYYMQYNDGQDEEPWDTAGGYEVEYTFAGYTSTFTVSVVKSPVAYVEIEPVKVVDGQGCNRYYDYSTGEYYNYYLYYTPKYTVHYKNGDVSETDSESKPIFGEYYSLEKRDTQQSEHWVLGGTYTVPCTFAGVACSFEVSVVETPVDRVEIDDIVLTENMGGYLTTDAGGSEYYYYGMDAPKYTVYLKDGSNTETGRENKLVYNYSYPLEFDWIDQSVTHFEPGHSYTVPCTFMGVDCSFNVTVNASPIADVVFEDINLIENFDGYESGYSGDEFFYYNYSSPKFTVYFNDGTDPITSSYGSIYYNNQRLSLNYSDPQYDTHFTLGANKVPCTFAGKKYEFTVNVIENPVEFIEFESLTVYENMGGFTDSDSGGNEYYRYNYGSPEYTLHFTDGQVSETNSGSKEVNGNYYGISFSDDQENEHWVAGGTYDVNWTFMNLSGTFSVSVEENPISWIEVDPVTLIHKVNCYTRTDSLGNEYYHYYIDSPQYTLHFKNGGQSEKTSGYTEINGEEYYLSYNIYQYQAANHFEAGNTYEVPCTFGGMETSFTVTVKNSPITNIVFNELSIIENTNGYISYDSESEQYYRYSYSPAYTVYFDDGTDSGLTTNYIRYGGSNYWPNTEDDQYLWHWSVGNTYQVSFSLLGYETTFPVKIVESPVVSVEVEKVVLLENTSGHTDTDSDGVEYFRYNYRPEYAVHLNDGTVTSKTSYSTRIGGSYYDLVCNDTQETRHWEVGNTYEVPFTFMTYSGTLLVEIKESPVSSVVVEPAEVIENISGYTDTDGDDNEFFYYTYSPKYTVYFKNGTHTTTDEYNKTVNGQSFGLTIYSDQYMNHWTVNNTYTVKYEFMSIECTSTVTVVKNPVKSVAVEDVKIIENTNGRRTTDGAGNSYYEYYDPDPKFVISFNDGRPDVTVIGGYNLGGTYNYLECSIDQSETHWTVGNTYTVPCTFMGVDSSFNVTIVSNPVIDVAVQDITVIENGDGNFNTDTYGNRYFNYYVYPTFTVFLDDGTTVKSSGSSVRIGGDWYYLQTDDDQYTNHWTVNNTYTVNYTFMGISGTFGVTIAENPIESIEVYDISLIEYSRGYYSGSDGSHFVYRYSPEFTVVYKDGTREENVQDSVNIGDKWYSIRFRDTQDDNYWSKDNTYRVTATLAGLTCDFNVSILPSPVQRIEIDNVSVIANSNGWLNTDENNVEYYCYDYSPKFRVYLSDNTSIESVDSAITIDGEEYYISSFEDGQYEEHWTVGNTYDVTAVFLGVRGSFKVSVVSSPVASIEVDDIVIPDGINTWSARDAYGNEYLRYGYSTPKYKAVFADGSSTEKNSQNKEINGQYYYLECEDTQETENWHVDGTYSVACEFAGIKSSFNVTVKPISYFASQIPTLIVNVPLARTYDGSVISGLACFAPTQSGSYTFYSTGKNYTDGFLYDADGKVIAEGYGDPTDPNFRIEAELTAGSTYYILVEPAYGGMGPGAGTYSFNVCVTGSDTPGACNHPDTEVRGAIAATCTQDGFSGEIYCRTCGEKISNGRVIPALGHTGGTATCHSKAICTRCNVEYGEFNPRNHDGETETRGASAATCTVNGYTGDVYCLSCGGLISEGSQTPLADHTVDEWLSNPEAHWHHCSVCDSDVDRAAHTLTWKVTKKATASENGLKEEICSVCGYKTGNTEAVVYGGYEPGDINDDGAVDNKDLIRLFQYLSDWGVEVNEDALDVNGDGAVDNKDLIRLFQYLSDWGVEIH